MSDSVIRISEIFGPFGYWIFNTEGETQTPVFVERFGVTQGEGKYVGTRSVFVRTYGCNLTCGGFGLPKGQVTNEPNEFAKTVHLYKNISETPAAQYGCDSYASWHPKFKKLSMLLDVKEVARMILQAAGGSLFKNPMSPIHIIFTGGEPMLPSWQKAYPALIDELRIQDPAKEFLKVIPLTVETNGTQELNWDAWDRITYTCDVTWSVSPKLSCSGEKEEDAILPHVIQSYLDISEDLYFKFVCQSPSDLDEVDAAVAKYKKVLLFAPPVYIMPEGGTTEEYQKHSTVELAAEAVKRGYNITPRLQVLIGANLTGW